MDSNQRAAPNLWPGGVVYFQFDSNVTSTQRELMYEAMEICHEIGAAVSFVPRTPGVDDGAYIHILDATGNSATVGNSFPGQQVRIFNWNFTYIMVHELLHALGYWHEHVRWDRDTFVSIVSANIQSGAAHNFTLKPAGDWIATSTPYDFESVMHYGGCAFSTCCSPGSNCACASGCETILAIPPGVQSTMGQRNRLSPLDEQDVRDAYGVGLRPRFLAWQSTSANAGTLLDPYESLAVMDNDAPPGSTVHVEAGTYNEGVLVLDRHVVIDPYGGVVTIR